MKTLYGSFSGIINTFSFLQDSMYYVLSVSKTSMYYVQIFLSRYINPVSETVTLIATDKNWKTYNINIRVQIMMCTCALGVNPNKHHHQPWQTYITVSSLVCCMVREHQFILHLRMLTSYPIFLLESSHCRILYIICIIFRTFL